MTPEKEEEKPVILEQEVKQEVKQEVAAAEEAKTEVNEGPLYGIQVLATTKKMDEKDPFFAGYKPVMIQTGKIYKYVIVTSHSLKEVKANLKKIQSKFPDNFIVVIEENKTTPVR